jgi:hypothetical protein
MKRLSVLGLTALLLVSACESERTLSDGKTYDCIGVGEDKEPTLKYKISGQNVAVAIIFSEMIAPPVVVLVSETYCPVSIREAAPPSPLKLPPAVVTKP